MSSKTIIKKNKNGGILRMIQQKPLALCYNRESTLKIQTNKKTTARKIRNDKQKRTKFSYQILHFLNDSLF